jgi:ATP-dependent helicase/DNAse subunit B
MSRVIITDPFPKPPAALPSDATVIAPNSLIGRPLGVPARSLQNHAKGLLKRAGFGIATPIRAAECLRQAVRDVYGSADASAVASHHREVIGAMLRSGVDLRRLAKVGSPRSRSAAAIAGRYVQILLVDKLIDPDAVLWAAVERELVQKLNVVIYGYFRSRQLEARPEELEFIDLLAGNGSIFYLPCGSAPVFAANREWLRVLSERGWEVDKSVSNRATSSGPESLAERFATGTEASQIVIDNGHANAFEFPDIESEVRGTLARAKAAILDGVSIRDIAIVCRDIEIYAPLLISVAREYRLPLEIDHEVPVRETAFGEFISLIFDVLELRSERDKLTGMSSFRKGFDYEPTLRLLLHRLGPGLDDEARTAAFNSRPSNFDRWAELCSEVDPLLTEGERTSAEWALWLMRLLTSWKVRGSAKLGHVAEEVAAYDRFREALDQHCRECGPAPISIADFVSDVVEILANIKTPLHTERGGLRVLLPNVVVGAEFEIVFVLGMMEGVLPAPSTDSNVIDFCERERLRQHDIHFENALEVPRWEALTFYFTLLAARRTVVFSFPRFAAGSERLESSYFKRLGIAPTRGFEQFLSSVEECRRALLTAEQDDLPDEAGSFIKHQFAVESRRESDAPSDKYDGVIGIPVRRTSWSASSLAKIGSCPFKWFASDVLMLREPDEADSDLPANVRGTLLHKTLELAANRSIDAADIRSEMLSSLGDAFSEAESSHGQLSVVANWELRRPEQMQKLERAILSDEFIDADAVIIETEKRFEATFCGMTIKGTIDRIDRLADGRLVAVDYKHGNYYGKIKDESGYLKVEIQLPIYSMLALPKLFPEDKIAGGRFLHLSEPKVTRSKEVDLEPLLTRIKTLLEEGRFAVDPDLDQKACEYCEFDVVCRVGPRVELKREHG